MINDNLIFNLRNGTCLKFQTIGFHKIFAVENNYIGNALWLKP